jgi:hypothetical protein
MIKEMKFHNPLPNKKIFNSNNPPSLEKSTISTGYATAREDPIVDSLKYFVQNSPSVKTVSFEEKKNEYKNLRERGRGFGTGTGSLDETKYDSNAFTTINADRFKSATFYNFGKPYQVHSNSTHFINFSILVKRMENLIEDFQLNVFDKMRRETKQNIKLKEELSSNVDLLTNKYKYVTKQLNDCSGSNLTTLQDCTKLEFLNERIGIENNHMKKEIPLIKNRISQVRIFLNTF